MVLHTCVVQCGRHQPQVAMTFTLKVIQIKANCKFSFSAIQPLSGTQRAHGACGCRLESEDTGHLHHPRNFLGAALLHSEAQPGREGLLSCVHTLSFPTLMLWLMVAPLPEMPSIHLPTPSIPASSWFFWADFLLHLEIVHPTFTLS